MKRFEYRWWVTKAQNAYEISCSQGALNELGAGGWEVVSIVQAPVLLVGKVEPEHHGVLFLLKREKPTREPRHPLDKKRRCPKCKKLTRVTTAGCDHCDFEDK